MGVLAGNTWAGSAAGSVQRSSHAVCICSSLLRAYVSESVGCGVFFGLGFGFFFLVVFFLEVFLYVSLKRELTLNSSVIVICIFFVLQELVSCPPLSSFFLSNMLPETSL